MSLLVDLCSRLNVPQEIKINPSASLCYAQNNLVLIQNTLILIKQININEKLLFS